MANSAFGDFGAIGQIEGGQMREDSRHHCETRIGEIVDAHVDVDNLGEE